MSHNKSLNELSLDELMLKAREMQAQMQTAHDRLSNAVVIGMAGDNNDIQIRMNGKYQVISTTIADHVDADKVQLANLVTMAINDAISKLELIAQA